ncbi:hypothetical protein B0H67DRAFT_671720, partial [Lasiosphaeris hirsuta]
STCHSADITQLYECLPIYFPGFLLSITGLCNNFNNTFPSFNSKMKFLYYVAALSSVAHAVPQIRIPYWLQYICNCNNPSTGDIQVAGLCEEVKGVKVSRVWTGVSGVDQTQKTTVCLVAAVLWSEYNPGPDVFTEARCAKTFGVGYNSFCAFYARSLDNPAYPGYPHFPNEV